MLSPACCYIINLDATLLHVHTECLTPDLAKCEPSQRAWPADTTQIGYWLRKGHNQWSVWYFEQNTS